MDENGTNYITDPSNPFMMPGAPATMLVELMPPVSGMPNKSVFTIRGPNATMTVFLTKEDLITWANIMLEGAKKMSDLTLPQDLDPTILKRLMNGKG